MSWTDYWWERRSIVADNVQSEAVVTGGTNWACDDIGSVFFPRNKLVFGADGSNDGDVDDALPLPVNSALRTDVIQNANTQLTPKFAVIDNASSGDNTIVAAVADKKIRVLCGLLMAAGTVTVRFESGAAGTALTGQLQLIAQVGFQIPFCPLGNFESASGVLLNLELSDAISVDGWLVYLEV
jgi:hypothetical protein